MIFLNILGVLLLLLLLPVRVRVDYRSALPMRLRLYVCYIPIRLPTALLDRLDGAKKKPPEKKKETQKDKKPKTGQKKKKSPFSDKQLILDLLRESKTVLRKLCKRTVLYRYEIKGRIGRPDAHSTALAYGRMAALASVSTSLLEELFTLRKPHVQLAPDFCSSTSRWDISIGIGIRPIFLLAAAMQLLVAFFSAKPPAPKKKVKPRKRQYKKGGTVYESAASHQ